MGLLFFLLLRHHIAAIQQVIGAGIAYLLGNADAGSVVAIRRAAIALPQNHKLIEAVVLVQFRTVDRALTQEIATVGVVKVSF